MKATKFFIIFQILLNFHFSKAAEAQPSELHFDPGVLIKVLDWDDKLKVFTVASVKMPGEGEFEVSLEEFVQANSKLSLADVQKNPDSLINHEYKLDKNLNVLSQKELKMRELELKKTKK